MMSLVWILVLCVVFDTASGQAPGDEADRCNETFYVHHYPDNVKILMDNWNYEQLLPGSGSGSNPIAGAVWSDISCDSNDVTAIINPSYVSLERYMYSVAEIIIGYMCDNIAQMNTLCHLQLQFDTCISVSFSVAAWQWRSV